MIDYKNIPWWKVMKEECSQNLQLWLRNGLKLPRGKKLIAWSLQTILLCIVGELAGGGSMPVAVGVSGL